MRVRGKGLGDRLLLMPPSSTQSSPPPTLGSSSPGLPAGVHLATKVTQQKRVDTLESDALSQNGYGVVVVVEWLIILKE